MNTHRFGMGIAFVSLALVGCGGDGVSLAPCGYGVTLEGGMFAPRTCEFQVVTGGAVACADCPASTDYVIALEDNAPGHVHSVTFFNFIQYAERSFVFDPETPQSDFKGAIIDGDSVSRHLLAATVMLEPAGTEVHATFDATFASDIHVRGEGTLPVVNVSAP